MADKPKYRPDDPRDQPAEGILHNEYQVDDKPDGIPANGTRPVAPQGPAEIEDQAPRTA